MNKIERKAHWENIYQTKPFQEVSWYQPIPEIALDFIEEQNLPLTSAIIDIGGGDSFLAEHLLEKGYRDITVLDISEEVIKRAQNRLGDKASLVNWMVLDVLSFQAERKYDLWYDRATFHFLTTEEEISQYVQMVYKGVADGGLLLIGTFSEAGPLKCSGIEIKQYSERTMSELWQPAFEKMKCFYTDHQTPFNTTQNFVFCSFRKNPG